MESFELISVWQAFRRKNWSVQFHSHRYYELVYYTKGGGQSQVGGDCCCFWGGMFIVLPPDTVHNEFHSVDGSVICLGFDTDARLPVGIFSDRAQTVYGILQDILEEASAQRFGYKALLKARLTELCVRILRLQQTPASNTKNFEYIIRYLTENYHEKIMLADCAKQLNLSYDYFQHRFRQLTGFSPQAFLLEQRLKASRQLLESGALSCTEIAYRCGFSTSAQFSMQFKRAFGRTPNQYKKDYAGFCGK